MTNRVAILGLGARGLRWAETCLAAGWEVSGFDPDDRVSHDPGWQRADTISSAVKGANWVICCLPDRLELIRTVVQRAQAQTAGKALIAVATRAFDVDAVQGCAIRPGQVFRLNDGENGGIALDVTGQNNADTRQHAAREMAMLAAADSVILHDKASVGAQARLA